MPKEGVVDIPPMPIAMTGVRQNQPDTVFRKVENFLPTEEGGLKSISTPIPLVPKPVTGGPPDNGTPDATVVGLTYGSTYGLFHCRLMQGQRDVLLVQVQDQVWEFHGWSRSFRVLLGPSTASPYQVALIPYQVESDFPLQCVATPTGVVIIPQGARAYFFDGTKVLPLGYDRAPGPAVGLGPQSSADTWFPDPGQFRKGINDAGYALDGETSGDLFSSMTPYFRNGRLGTLDTPGNISFLSQGGEEDSQAQIMAYLLPGRYRFRYAWIDDFGNISPLSPESNDVTFERQPAMRIMNNAGTPELKWARPETVQKQVFWTGIQVGPEGTRGRIGYRTKDLENSGDFRFLEVPRDSMVSPTAFATLPDNMSTSFPDNIPDAWLVNEPLDVVPVPTFRVAVVAHGRLFVGGISGREATIMWSMPGRWGTFLRGADISPDPSAGEVTGFAKVKGGALAFTARSTFLIEPSDDGKAFKTPTLHPTVGCVAPSSVATLKNGLTIWLGEDGFYGYADGQISFLFLGQEWHAKRFNRARLHRAAAGFDHKTGQYRCWLAYEGSSKNNVCFCFDGEMWTTRTDIAASGVAVTDDHRRQMLCSGVEDVTDKDGIWVLDSAGDPVTATIETAWLRSTRALERSSIRRVRLHLRETGQANTSDKITISVLKDYRAEVVSVQYVPLSPPVDSKYGPVPTIWGVDDWGSSEKWRTRRSWWASVDVDTHGAEVVMLRISAPKRFEILAVAFEEQPRNNHGTFGR